MGLPIISIDFETKRISFEGVYPEPVCMSVYRSWDGSSDLFVVGEHDVEAELAYILELCLDGQCLLINQSIAFDMRVAATAWPDLLPLILQAYEYGCLGDTMLREKLLDLSTHGNVGYQPTPNGGLIEKKYKLSDMVMSYFNVDITENKTGADSWRLRYSELIGVPLARWPRAAVDYALDDPRWATEVWVAQTERIEAGHTWPVENDEGTGGVNSTEGINLRSDFVHTAVTQRGLILDPEYAQTAWDEAREAHEIENFPLLVECGIVVPEVPPTPYANGAVDINGNPRMKRAVKEKVSKKHLQGYVIESGRILGVKLDLTDKGVEGYQAIYGERKLSVPAIHECFTEHPEWASAAKGTINTLADMGDEVAMEMRARSHVEKLVTSYFPGLIWDYAHDLTGKKALGYLDETKAAPPNWIAENADVRWATSIHPNFDLLKETGRSSSYGGDLYPSVNIQQVDPRVRGCYVAREGYILVSIDYSSLELFSAAWTWKQAIGSSVLFDLLCEGMDPHGYLAAQLSHLSDPKSPVKGNSPRERYECFHQWKKLDKESTLGKYYEKWRKMAKAVGLGFPGGLGVDTFITFAWSTYKVRVTRDEAFKAREIWMQTFPEAREYLKEWVYANAYDEGWVTWNEEGEKQDRFQYTSPGGMVRRNCTYTAAANGKALQTPSAEGFKRAEALTYYATLDEDSPLFGSYLVAVIHDEILFEIPLFEDYSLTNSAILHAQKLMEQGMMQTLDGIPIRTEACAMYRWDKNAERAFTAEGWLVPVDDYPYELYESLK